IPAPRMPHESVCLPPVTHLFAVRSRVHCRGDTSAVHIRTGGERLLILPVTARRTAKVGIPADEITPLPVAVKFNDLPHDIVARTVHIACSPQKFSDFVHAPSSYLCLQKLQQPLVLALDIVLR